MHTQALINAVTQHVQLCTSL